MRLSTPKSRLAKSLGELSEVASSLQLRVETSLPEVHRAGVGDERLARDLNLLNDGLEELVCDVVAQLQRVQAILQHTYAGRQKTA